MIMLCRFVVSHFSKNNQQQWDLNVEKSPIDCPSMQTVGIIYINKYTVASIIIYMSVVY